MLPPPTGMMHTQAQPTSRIMRDHSKKVRTFTQSLKIKLLSYFGTQNSLLRIFLLVAVLLLGIIVGGTLFASAPTVISPESTTGVTKEREMDIKYVQDNMVQMLREVVHEEQLTKQLFSANKDQVPQLRKNEPKSALFFRYFITCSRPLILTGAKAIPSDKWPIFNEIKDKNFLGQRAGNMKVTVESSPSKVFPMLDTQVQQPVTKVHKGAFSVDVRKEDIQLQAQIGKSVPNRVSKHKITQEEVEKVLRGERLQNVLTSGLKTESVTTEEITLSEFLNKYDKKAPGAQTNNYFLPPTKISDGFASDFPQPPAYMDTLTYLHTALQMSYNGHVIPLHQYTNETLIAQVKGSTVFLLFDPLQIEFLFPKPLRDNGELVISQVDPFDIELHKKPEFAKYSKASSLRVELEEGEILYIPSYWWVYEYGHMMSNENVILKQYYKPHSASYELVMRGLTRKNGPVILNHLPTPK
jgi:hypothetical protein